MLLMVMLLMMMMIVQEAGEADRPVSAVGAASSCGVVIGAGSGGVDDGHELEDADDEFPVEVVVFVGRGEGDATPDDGADYVDQPSQPTLFDLLRSRQGGVPLRGVGEEEEKEEEEEEERRKRRRRKRRRKRKGQRRGQRKRHRRRRKRRWHARPHSKKMIMMVSTEDKTM